MITQEVNVIAMATAAEFVVGREAADKIGELYKLLDAAMYAGYELGKTEANQETEEAINEAFDNGWDLGEQEGHATGLLDVEEREDDAWGRGYLDGVGDARARPQMADSWVQTIIKDQLQDDLNGSERVGYDTTVKHNASVEGASWEDRFDPDNVSDSGDEDDYFDDYYYDAEDDTY